VLVLGGGFAGLEACRALRGAPCEILLVDRQNHHLFQPLLYQVATAGLSGSDIAQPLRSMLAGQSNVQVHRATAVSIDLASRTVAFRDEPDPIEYDHLVLGLGLVTNWFGHASWSRYAIGLKTLHDAYRIRDRMLDAAEAAENLVDDPDERRRLLTTVVVGSGPTGVEMAGAMAELGRREIETEYRIVRAHQLRIVLVSADDRPLSSFHPELSRRTLDDLRSLGVDVRLSSPVRDLREGEVVLDGETIAAHTIVWAAGVRAPSIVHGLGVPLDRVGRILVEPDCSLPGHPNVFAVGDLAAMRVDPGDPGGPGDPASRFVPGVAQGAMQSGAHVGRTIRDRLRGGAVSVRPFRYQDRGSMATIGRAKAVAEIGGRRFGGLVAWLLWLFIHLAFLIDLRSKASVLLKWIAAYVFYRPSNRIVAAAPTDDETADGGHLRSTPSRGRVV
jgi:NADH dehydrogenase